MKSRCCFALVLCVVLSSCNRDAPATSYDADWERKSKQQFDDFDRQTKVVDASLAVTERQSKRADAALDKSDQQARRFDLILEKWEEQARRQDAILEAQEKKLGISK
jgi:hypothetical protein